MATNKQEEAARRNIGKARQAQSARAHGSLLGGASGNGLCGARLCSASLGSQAILGIGEVVAMRAAGSPDPRNESEAERDDRYSAELLQELRVAGLGVQVLFGFLLSLPFTTRFARLSHGQRQPYLATLVLSALGDGTAAGNGCLSSAGVPPRPEGRPSANGERDGHRRAGCRRLGRVSRRPAGDRFCRQRVARGADHRLCRLHIRYLVVRVPARPPTLTRPGSTSRGKGFAGQAWVGLPGVRWAHSRSTGPAAGSAQVRYPRSGWANAGVDPPGDVMLVLVRVRASHRPGEWRCLRG